MTDISNFRRKKELDQAKAAAIEGLAQIAQIASLAAQELKSGDLTRSPVDLSIEFAEQLKALEEFRDLELLSVKE